MEKPNLEKFMKSFVLATALLGIATLQSPATAGVVHPTKFNAVIDGHCDVFALKISGWQLYGKQTGCSRKWTSIGTVADIGGTTWYISNYESIGTGKYVMYFTPPVNGAGNWYLYFSNGKSYVAQNSGTYSKPTPGAEMANADKPSVLGR